MRRERAPLQTNALPLHGPFYLVLIVATLLAGWTDAEMPLWIALAGLVLIGGKIIWWARERAWGRYNEPAS